MKQNKKINRRVFAMITDFGFDFSVASMKALILKEFSDAQIIDVDHSIKQFSILSGAFVIDKIYRYFPEQTIFICVVDPGVGSKREPIFIDTGNYRFIGPNNGLFHYILTDPKISYKSCAIKEEFRSIRSTTFHGRDLFTPAAIEIARGNFDIVQPIDKEKLVLISPLNSGLSVITYIDGFGNIKTNISFRDEFKKTDLLKINVNNTLHLIKVSNTFSDVSKRELLCYKGSNDTLEIAANLASAEQILNAEVGDSITVEQ
ncbi:SAM-dependent chlorinase/fluorinase [Candidatus Azambacteria bacterium]|nr:SAM-dependent chlorinase/fluorinase [Candidatus Azambacteria bacterium]